MAKPYSDEHADIAEDILGKALDDLQAAGLGHVEAMHHLMHCAIDMLPAFCCRHHLGAEYAAIVEVIEDRIAEIPNMVPGVDIAACPEDAH
jgi:hypothetical protein